MKTYSLLFLFFSFTSLAASLVPSEQSKVTIEIPYSMGEHVLNAQGLSGKIEWDEKTNTIQNGELKLAIVNIKAKKSKMECHLRESLGLDYKNSDFPDEHVCDDDDQLPKEGANSIKYSDVTATLVSPLKTGKNVAQVRWNIHGKTKEMVMPITVSKDDKGEVVLDSKWKMKLSDYDIVVKKFLFIAVEDEFSVKMNLHFKGGI